MRHALIGGAEEILGRKVIAFFGDNTIEPDVAPEAFLLAPDHPAHTPTAQRPKQRRPAKRSRAPEGALRAISSLTTTAAGALGTRLPGRGGGV